MEKKNTFNEVISDYAYARPTYPNKLFEDIKDFSGLSTNANILEIGAGTGQATDYYANNKTKVTALEIGEKQANYLKNKYKDNKSINIVCTSFEDFICNDAYFDLIFSATAFHWIRADIGYQKAYNLLHKGGTIAVFWHMSSVTRYKDKMFEDIRSIYLKYAPEVDASYSKDKLNEIHELRVKEIQSGGYFPKPQTKIYSWKDEYTSKKYISLLNTYSSFQMLEKSKREIIYAEVKEYIDKNGGKISLPQEVRLYMSKK